MLIAIQQADPLNIHIFYWSPGTCAQLDGFFAGYSTDNHSSHPANSEQEFIHKVVTSPRRIYINTLENRIEDENGNSQAITNQE